MYLFDLLEGLLIIKIAMRLADAIIMVLHVLT
jgi:hypothetical protein